MPDADTEEIGGAEVPTSRVPQIESRFLFVDVAAQRAKQLRRGALPRLKGGDHRLDHPHKLERVAMEEVQQGLVSYELPEVRTHLRESRS